jgi:hypothetical protein
MREKFTKHQLNEQIKEVWPKEYLRANVKRIYQPTLESEVFRKQLGIKKDLFVKMFEWWAFFFDFPRCRPVERLSDIIKEMRVVCRGKENLNLIRWYDDYFKK